MTRSLASLRFSALSLGVVLVLGAPACKPGGASKSDAGPAMHDGAAPAPVASGLPAPADVAAPPIDALKTASGLASKVIAPGTGTDHPGVNDEVKVNYTGWTTDGKMFDSSIASGQPKRFPLNRVIKGWGEGLQLMKVGDKMRFWVPAKLAYDDPDRPKRPGAPAGMLVFDVELLDIPPAPPMGMGGPPHGMSPMQQMQMQQQMQQQQQQSQTH